jgi:hypothetical protein
MLTTAELIRHINGRRGWFSARDVTDATATQLAVVAMLLTQLVEAEFLDREIHGRSAIYFRVGRIPEDFSNARTDQWGKPKQTRRPAPAKSIPKPVTLAELLMTIGEE